MRHDRERFRAWLEGLKGMDTPTRFCIGRGCSLSAIAEEAKRLLQDQIHSNSTSGLGEMSVRDAEQIAEKWLWSGLLRKWRENFLSAYYAPGS